MRAQSRGRSHSAAAAESHGAGLTIGRLAAAAHVGVETIRYYQRRALLPIPPTAGVRRYPSSVLHRIQFIKHSQALGFSLEEIRELLRLEDGGTRAEVRRIAEARLGSVRDKLAALQKMEQVLGHLLARCASSAPHAPCPIIGALASQAGALGTT